MIIRGKHFSHSDIKLFQKIIFDNPDATRRKLSLLIAEQLDWRQPNGRLKDRAVREVLLRLLKKKIISLPSPLYKLEEQTAGVKQIYFPEPSGEMVGRIDDYGTPVLTIVKNNHDRKLWNFD